MNAPGRLCVPRLLVVVAVAAIAAGCTLALDTQECDGDDDCVEQYGDSWTCSADHICQPECETDDDCLDHGSDAVCGADHSCYAAGDTVPCETSEDCHETFDSEWTCPEDGGICEPPADAIACDDDGDCPDQQICNDLNICQDSDLELLEEPCTITAGDIDDDDAFLVGVLLPFTGDEAPFGQALFNGITLALSDFNQIGGVDGRSFGIVGCDTQGRNDLALEGARHLDDVGIEAVIGPDWSDQTRETALEVTIDAQMTQVSPSATEAGLAAIGDLLWRTASSDAIQGRALSELINHLLVHRPHYQGLDDASIPDEPSVAILRRQDDSYALGLREAITDDLAGDLIDDGRDYLDAYANEAAGDPVDYHGVAADLGAATQGDFRDTDSFTAGDFNPDVVAIIGSAEAWELAELIDDQLQAQNPPAFVFADAARLPDSADQAPDELTDRIWGTAPQNVSDIGYAPYNRFRLRYQENFDEDPEEMQFVPHAYDALYVIGLGAAYGGFEGTGISEGIHQLRDGETHEPSIADLQSATSELAAGNSVNFDGASGPLNLDEDGDPEPKPTSLWCFRDGGVPEEGVILDESLEFTPRYCGAEPDAPDCTEDDDCDDGQVCDDDTDTCVDDPGVECTDAGDCPVIDNADAECADADCIYSCDAGFGMCDGDDTCIELTNNDDHCGECDNDCPDDQHCQDSSCVADDTNGDNGGSNGDNGGSNGDEEPE